MRITFKAHRFFYSWINKITSFFGPSCTRSRHVTYIYRLSVRYRVYCREIFQGSTTFLQANRGTETQVANFIPSSVNSAQVIWFQNVTKLVAVTDLGKGMFKRA